MEDIVERDFAGAQLSEENYALLADLCRGDAKFPTSYPAWQELIAAGTRRALEEGQPAGDISVGVDEFEAWCARVAIHPCFDALRAYLIIGRRGGHFGHTDLRTKI